MFDYEYLEPFSERGGENPAYRLAPDLAAWIRAELAKRRDLLSHEREEEVSVLLTMRQYRKSPVFLLGLQQADESVDVIEGWYFHMIPPPPEQAGTVQLALDRVKLDLLFPEFK